MGTTTAIIIATTIIIIVGSCVGTSLIQPPSKFDRLLRTEVHMKLSTISLTVVSLLVTANAYADARFKTPSLYALPASPVAAVADDFDADGILDIASATADGHAVVLPGLGD